MIATTQAPCVNLDTMIAISASPLPAAPAALTARPQRHRGSRSRRCRTVMPAWENVKEAKTPTA